MRVVAVGRAARRPRRGPTDGVGWLRLGRLRAAGVAVEAVVAAVAVEAAVAVARRVRSVGCGGVEVVEGGGGGRAAKLESQLRQVKRVAAARIEGNERRVRWAMETRESGALYKKVKGAHTAVGREVLAIRPPPEPGSDVQTAAVCEQSEIASAFETHAGRTANLGRSEAPANQTAEEAEAQQQLRAAARRSVIGKVSAHMEGLEGEKVAEAMRGLTLESIFSKENIDKAITEVKKGRSGTTRSTLRA